MVPTRAVLLDLPDHISHHLETKKGEKVTKQNTAISHQPPFLSSVRKQQQERSGPVTERGDGREEAQRGMKRAAAGERQATQEEYPQEFSISKYVLIYTEAKTNLCIMIFRVSTFTMQYHH